MAGAYLESQANLRASIEYVQFGRRSSSIHGNGSFDPLDRILREGFKSCAFAFSTMWSDRISTRFLKLPEHEFECKCLKREQSYLPEAKIEREMR